MKKLIILFALFLWIGTADAQTKKTLSKPTESKGQPITSANEESSAKAKGPTKEETITASAPISFD